MEKYNPIIDFLEEKVLKENPSLLKILLFDQTSKRYIKWGTDNYTEYGDGYGENDFIKPSLITGKNKEIIKPRILKSSNEQKRRSKEKGEVFTPSWMCNKQNNAIDVNWFNKQNVFNIEKNKTWSSTKKVDFGSKSFVDYIKETRIEIACGEAPYLTSRYDTLSGKYIEVNERIGLLDRKLRVISENTNNFNDWYKYSKIAYQNIYGFDYQGDNVLIARENLLMTFIDFYKLKFNKTPASDKLLEIATILSWNIWQMDATKFVIPGSCIEKQSIYVDLLGEEHVELTKCRGCESGLPNKHNGIYCRIKDWSDDKEIKFIDLCQRKL